MNRFSPELETLLWMLVAGYALLKALAMGVPAYLLAKWMLCQRVHDPERRAKLSRRFFWGITLVSLTISVATTLTLTY